MSEWQPIETAPKDGTEVFVAEYGDVKVASWSRRFNYWMGPYDLTGDIEHMHPTHWMPLPPPPKDENGTK